VLFTESISVDMIQTIVMTHEAANRRAPEMEVLWNVLSPDRTVESLTAMTMRWYLAADHGTNEPRRCVRCLRKTALSCTVTSGSGGHSGSRAPTGP
jgi:hypothetical protein